MFGKESKKARRMREKDEGLGIRRADYGVLTWLFEEKTNPPRKEEDDGTGTRRIRY